jgi:type 1 glutamine amidotransferase
VTHRRSRCRSALIAAAALSAALIVPASAASSRPAAEAAPPRVLVWGGAYGFRHPSITTGEKAFLELAQETGDFSVTVTENPADLSMATLRNYDVLAWISTTGKPPLTEQQREDVIRWAACGGGNMGFHAVLDSDYGWAEHAELFGAQFDSHPKNAGTGAARMLVEDRAHPITAGWKAAPSFMLDDEYYRWRTAKRVPGISLPRNEPTTDVLLSLDESTVGGDIQNGPLAYEHHQPVAWTKTFRDKGRVYYNNMGHSDSTWGTAPFRTALVNGVTWVSQVRPDQKCLLGTGDVSSKPTPPAPAKGTVGKPCPVPAVKPREGGFTWEQSGPFRRLTEKGDSQAVAAGVVGGLQWGAQHWVLDLSRSRAERADVTVELTWPIPVDDYDLSVTTAWGFYGSHALVGATTEQLVLTGVPHCAILQTYAENMAATSGQAPTLAASVKTVKPTRGRR